MKKRKSLREKSRYLRTSLAYGLSPEAPQPVQREGGDYRQGIIRGFAVATRGEAIGHNQWLDTTFLAQVSDALNQAPRGVKSRFTHPGLSGDGLGKHLGRTRGGSLDGEIARGDLHFASASRRSPEGHDYASYLMDLAVEDPASFGTSIVFEHDVEAETAFMLAHGGRLEVDLAGFETIVGFKSPDPDNVHNFPHVRLKKLMAVDPVGDPAANPSGLFSAEQSVAVEAEALAAYALGLTDQPPAVSQFGVHPERVRPFVQRFLDRRGLSIVPLSKETRMQTEQNATGAVVESDEAKPSEASADPITGIDDEEDDADTGATNAQAEQDTALSAANDRAAEIVSLCQIAGRSDLAAEFIRDTKFGVADVKLKLLALRAKENSPIGESTGVSAHEAPKDPDAKFKAEYAEGKVIHRKLGVTEASYIKMRRREEGVL